MEIQNKVLNILLVTHNSRMRCFLEDTVKPKMDEYRKAAAVDEIRFKNGAVLLLKIVNGKKTLSLVFEGTVNKPKKGAYFTTEPNSEDKIKNIKYLHFDDIEDVNLNLNLNQNIDYNIYIVRHGEAYHNVAMLNIYRDTDLTKDGIEQADSAGKFFKPQNINFDYYFSSYLKRSRQTINYILEAMDKIESQKQIIVLPCAHELAYNIEGKCDVHAQGKPVPPENMMVCSGRNEPCNTIDYCCTTPRISIDWDYYQKFYSPGRKCRDTNMIQEIISYVEAVPIEEKIQQGGNFYRNKYQKCKERYLKLKHSISSTF